MGFVTAEQKRQIRLKRSRTVDLAEGSLTVRIAPMLANRAFNMTGDKKDLVAGKADLFIGACITEKGDPLFKTPADVEDFLEVINIYDATLLIDEINKLTEEVKPPGNSEASQSAS